MVCLAHDKRYRSMFHNIINELRNDKTMPTTILRTMPNKCCTCNEQNTETKESVVLIEDTEYIKLKDLITRVKLEKDPNPKLILSINQFQKLIQDNRTCVPLLTESKSVEKQNNSKSKFNNQSFSDSEDGLLTKGRARVNSSSSDSDDNLTSMDTSKFNVRCRKKSSHNVSKPSKLIKNGTFLFLPYSFDDKTQKGSNYLLKLAKNLQRNRFISSTGHIGSLETQYNVRINMITSKTSKQVTDALEKAQQGLNDLQIVNSKNPTKTEIGEWVLIRAKNSQNSSNFDQAIDDLTNRWENCLKIKKRGSDEADNFDNQNSKKR